MLLSDKAVYRTVPATRGLPGYYWTWPHAWLSISAGGKHTVHRLRSGLLHLSSVFIYQARESARFLTARVQCEATSQVLEHLGLHRRCIHIWYGLRCRTFPYMQMDPLEVWLGNQEVVESLAELLAEAEVVALSGTSARSPLNSPPMLYT